MNFDFRKILVTILSIVVTILGGAQYQQSSTLNEMQNDFKLLAKTVDSVANRDIARFESE